MNHPAFDSKDPAESLPLGIDFAAVLLTGETISTATWASEVLAVPGGVDSTPLALSGGATTGPIVAKTVAGGTHGLTYKLRAVITTSASRTLVGCALLPVARC